MNKHSSAFGVVAIAIGSMTIASCTLADLELEGRSCPCITGYVCSSSMTCVKEGSIDAGIDASIDAPLAERDTSCDTTLSDTVVCEGFEEDNLSTWSDSSAGMATTKLVSDVVYRGRGALEIDLGEGGAFASRSKILAAPITAGNLHARFYVRLPTDKSFQFYMLASLIENVAPFGGINASLSGGRRMHLQVKPEESLSQEITSNQVVAQDRWTCIQLDVVGASDATGSATISLDGEVYSQLVDLVTLPAGGVSNLLVGVVFSIPAQQPARLHIDEYAFDRMPIPCD